MSAIEKRHKKVRVDVAYGSGKLSFGIPRSMLAGILEKRIPKGRPARLLTVDALKRPLGGRSLEDTVKGKRKVLVVVPDDTRSAHLKDILPILLGRIDNRSREINIIVATGLHKIHTSAQLKELLGARILKRYNVLNHELGAEALVGLGTTSRGVPISLDRNLFDHDLVLSIGTIEPHLYAGYSGGAKTVAIGLAGADTVDATHGVRFLGDRMTALASIDENPFQDTLWEIAGKTPLQFSVNVVNDSRGRAVKVLCGSPREVFDNGVSFARSIYEVYAGGQADIVVCGIGYPKDVNLYQASRAINYILNVDRPVLKRGGVLIIAAELKRGIGTSATEQKFCDTLRTMDSPEKYLERAARKGFLAGEHRTFMVAGPLSRYKIIFVTPGGKGFMEGLPLGHFCDIDKALSCAVSECAGRAKAYVIPHALATVARARS